MKKWAAILLCIPAVLLAQAPDIAWQKLIGGAEYDALQSAILTDDGGYLLTGSSSSPVSGDKTVPLFGSGGADIWVLQLDQDRNIQWQAVYGGVGSSIGSQSDGGLGSLVTDGGYLVAGQSNSDATGNKTEYCRGGWDYWLISIDDVGNPLWQKAYGGSANDYLESFVATSDGNFLLAGYSYSSISGEKNEDSRGDRDAWVIKIDPQGNIIWQRTIGGSGDDQLRSAHATMDDGVVLAITSKSPISGEKSENSYGLSDYWIVKLDSNGVITWQKTIGGSNSDNVTSIIPTDDGGYFICGSSGSPISGLKTESAYGVGDFWVLKLDDQGNIVWQKSIGGNDNDGPASAMEIAGKGFLIAGGSASGISGNKTVPNFGGVFDGWLVRLDQDGNTLWQKELGGSGWDNGFDMLAAPDDGIILSGWTDSSNSGTVDQAGHGLYDYWLLKLNPEELATGTHANPTLSVWPNPTHHAVNVRFPENEETVVISVCDVLGRLVYSHEFENVSTLNGLELGAATGLYVLKVQTAHGTQSIKVLKN